MNILLWIIFGAITGWISSIIMKSDFKQGTFKDIVMGIVGAFVGGSIMNYFGLSGVSGFNFYSLLVATFGAVIVIYIGRMIRNG